MFLLEVYSDFLNEAKIDLVKKRYPDYSIYLDFFKDVKPKYLEWIGKEASKNKRFSNFSLEKSFNDPGLISVGFDKEMKEWIQKNIQLIQTFDKFCESNIIKDKDINSYYDFNELKQVVEKAEIDYKKSQEEKESVKKAKKEAKRLFEDENYLVIQPTSEKASCIYGKGSEWCISATQSANYFDDYTQRGFKFVFIINKKTDDKDAIAYNPGLVVKEPNSFEIYDARDKQVTWESIKQKYPSNIINIIEEHTSLNENFDILLDQTNSEHKKLLYKFKNDNFVLHLKYKSLDENIVISINQINENDFIFYRNLDHDNEIKKIRFEEIVNDYFDKNFLTKIEEYFGKKIFVVDRNDIIISLEKENPYTQNNNSIHKKLFDLLTKSSDDMNSTLKTLVSVSEVNLRQLELYSRTNNESYSLEEKEIMMYYNFYWNISSAINLFFDKKIDIQNIIKNTFSNRENIKLLEQFKTICNNFSNKLLDVRIDKTNEDNYGLINGIQEKLSKIDDSLSALIPVVKYHMKESRNYLKLKKIYKII